MEKAKSLPLYCVFPFAELTFGSGGLDLNLPNLFSPLHAKIKVTKTTSPFRPLKYLSSRGLPVLPLPPLALDPPLKAYARNWHPKTVIFGNGLSALLVVHVPRYHGNLKNSICESLYYLSRSCHIKMNLEIIKGYPKAKNSSGSFTKSLFLWWNDLKLTKLVKMKGKSVITIPYWLS